MLLWILCMFYNLYNMTASMHMCTTFACVHDAMLESTSTLIYFVYVHKQYYTEAQMHTHHSGTQQV